MSQGRITITRSPRLSIAGIAAALGAALSGGRLATVLTGRKSRGPVAPDIRRALKAVTPRRPRRSGAPKHVFGGGAREVARRQRQLAAGHIYENAHTIRRNRLDASANDEPVRRMVFR